MTIYAGGAVDYVDREYTHNWRHRLPGKVFCPLCENEGSTDVSVIMDRNMQALRMSDRAVFLLDGYFTVGTPIEAWLRRDWRGPASMVIVHPGKDGIFVQHFARSGVLIARSLPEVAQWLRS